LLAEVVFNGKRAATPTSPLNHGSPTSGSFYPPKIPPAIYSVRIKLTFRAANNFNSLSLMSCAVWAWHSHL